MSHVLFDYPEQAAFNRILPKNKIYEYARPGRRIRDSFVSQIEQIIWQYKLAPETINLPARPGVPEIQVFSVTLKNQELNPEVLRTIDKVIAFPIFYELNYGENIRMTAAYKRPSDADSSQWVVDSYFESDWLHAGSKRTPLPVALDMAVLYEQMLRQLMPLSARTGETLKVHAERLAQIQSRQNECRKLKIQLQKEKQFNRKVEINAQLRAIQNELDKLTH